jgi:hypothetical protein
MNNIRDKYVSVSNAIIWVWKKYIYRDGGEVLSIPPMGGILLTPKSVHTVKAPSYVILTVIYVAVTMRGCRQPETHHTQWRRGYLLHRLIT